MSNRRSMHGVRTQLRFLTPVIVAWDIALVILAIAGLQNAVPVDEIFSPQASGDEWYARLVPELILAQWAVAAAMGFVGGWVARKAGRAAAGKFLRSGGFVSLFFLLDELLHISEDALPAMFNGNHTVSGLLIILPIAIWTVMFQHEVRRTRWLMLAVALLAFEVSVVVEAYTNGDQPLFSSGAMMLGAVAWVLWFTLTVRDVAASSIRTARGQQSDGEAEDEDDEVQRDSVPQLA